MYDVARATGCHVRPTESGGSSTTCSPRGTPIGHSTRKLHGFGTGPATRGNPCRSVPVAIRTVYWVQSVKGDAGVRVSTVPTGGFEFQLYASVAVGERVHETVGVAIGSLKVTTMPVPTGTTVAPPTGLVETTYGAASAVVKLHGFGSGPETRAAPPVSSPAVIVTVYVVSSMKSVG